MKSATALRSHAGGASTNKTPPRIREHVDVFERVDRYHDPAFIARFRAVVLYLPGKSSALDAVRAALRDVLEEVNRSWLNPIGVDEPCNEQFDADFHFLLNFNAPLVVMAATGVTDAVRVLLAEGHPPLRPCPQAPRWTMGHFEAPTGASPTFDESERTAVSAASEHGHLDIVRLLVAHGADVDRGDPLGNTPVFYAAKMGYADVVGCLIGAGARLGCLSCAHSGDTPLTVAVRRGHVEVVRTLLLAGGRRCDVDAFVRAGESDDTDTALTLAARTGQSEIVRTLLVDGTCQVDKEVLERGEDGSVLAVTALSLAVRMGHRDVARMLRIGGASPP